MLKNRLKTVFDFIPQGSTVADIGTDHGFLPIALIKSGKCETVYACDIRRKPLENARKNIDKAGVNGITLLLSDGLEKIGEDTVDTVVIAGMGGEIIKGIMERCPWLKNNGKVFILQPITSTEELRIFLLTNGFEITEEKTVTDCGKVYAVIKTVYTGKITDYSPAYPYVGKIRPLDEDSKAYIEKQYRRIKGIVESLEQTDKKDELAKYSVIKDEIEKLSEI